MDYEKELADAEQRRDGLIEKQMMYENEIEYVEQEIEELRNMLEEHDLIN